MTTALNILDNAPTTGVCSAKVLCEELCIKHENNVYTFDDGSMIERAGNAFSVIESL